MKIGQICIIKAIYTAYVAYTVLYSQIKGRMISFNQFLSGVLLVVLLDSTTYYSTFVENGGNLSKTCTF